MKNWHDQRQREKYLNHNGAPEGESPLEKYLVFYFVFRQLIQCIFKTVKPDQSHCYFLSDHDSLNGYVVKKIPFSHPAQVPRILATLRKQAVFNAILSSCIRTSGIQGKDFCHSLVFFRYTVPCKTNWLFGVFHTK